MARGERACDVVVIGAGVVGCAVAATLALRGYSVVLIDAATVGGGTSSSSFSWLNATSKTSDLEYFRLNALSLQRYRDLATEWGAQIIGLHQCGMIEWANQDDDGKLEALRSAAHQLNEWSYPAEWLDRQQLQQLEPGLRFEDGAEGYFIRGDCWLDTPHFLHFLIERLQQAGGRLNEHCAAIELIANDSGRVLGIRTETEQISCPSIVVATGAQTADVLSQLTGYDGFKSRFPVHRAPGVLLTTPSLHARLVRHVLYTSHSSGLHVRDAGERRLLFGADDADGLVSEDSSEKGVAQAARLLLTRLSQFIRELDGLDLLSQCQIDIGVRAVPVDGRSIAGPALSAEGLYLIVTHSGVTLAPILAELIADCIETGKVPEQLIPFSLDRFDQQ